MASGIDGSRTPQRQATSEAGGRHWYNKHWVLCRRAQNAHLTPGMHGCVHYASNWCKWERIPKNEQQHALSIAMSTARACTKHALDASQRLTATWSFQPRALLCIASTKLAIMLKKAKLSEVWTLQGDPYANTLQECCTTPLKQTGLCTCDHWLHNSTEDQTSKPI